ncbi:TRAP transporter substrate-binding protein [Paenarthrobacter sp. Z7-10]|uniref:TRAP transporter substrate-binding protein n=1 Tax=Paenarthrobacter sp. Z7-10 TaxID=2787635 RepID=UPI0022A8DE01|nr:TRAP transporter substrate-binding protein [Paenarthrobacter sp. Z7-10]MCZ2403572.1 TRAP transporter substrate-binding protein [Paenarthrobacter sp. Z7-10]
MGEYKTSRRSMLKYGAGVLLSAAAVPLLSACGGTAAQSKGPLKLKMSSSMSGQPGNAHSTWFNKFQTTLKDKVGEAVTVDYFPNSQLGDEAKMVQQLRLGAADMMISGSSIWSQVAPEFGVLDMGYIFESWDAVGKSLDAGAGDKLSAILKDKGGAQIIGWAYNFGARNMLTKSAVAKPTDLHGLKIRTLQAPEVIDTVNLMGAVATPLPTTEVYTSLQTGLIEGLGHDAPTILQNKWYETAKHLALTEHIFNPLTIVIADTTLSKIPSEHRDAFMSAAQDATDYQRTQAVDAEKKAMTQLQAKGVTITKVDKAEFKNLVSPLWEKFTGEHAAAKPILDAILKQG